MLQKKCVERILRSSVLYLMMLCLLLIPIRSLGDDTGVLTEDELNIWLQRLLLSTMEQIPLNDPVGEESLTEYGYAFIFDMATLYYTQPSRDKNSRLNAVTLVEEGLSGPRGIGPGAPQEILMETYGWQNPLLHGDGSIAAFYTLNRLPQSAYWAWAQHEGMLLRSVRCAIHVHIAGDRYTDAGIAYQLEGGAVAGITVYGLQETLSLSEVRNNLEAVGQGRFEPDDEPGLLQAEAGLTIVPQNNAPVFAPDDLLFSGIDYRILDEKGAGAAFGPPANETLVQDDTGEWMRTEEREGVTLVYGLDRGKANGRLQMLSFTKAGLVGPRGIQIGQGFEEAAARFRSDGPGMAAGAEARAGNAAPLYGDGRNPPYGELEGQGRELTLRYVTACGGEGGESRDVTLHLVFTDKLLAEIMIYSW